MDLSTGQPKIESQPLTSDRDAKDQFPTNSPTAMHSHKNHKLSLFKTNRSQASLLSAQESRSYQASPIDSPLQSPAFPPPSAVSSLDSEDREDRFGQPYDQDALKFYHGNGDIPRRAQSQRAPPVQRSHIGTQPPQPTIHLIGSPQGGAASTRIDEDPDAYYDQQQQQQAPVKPEQKKKRRFFGFGESSTLRDSVNNSASNPPRGIGRSISVRRTDIGPRISTNTDDHPNQQRWPPGSAPPAYSSAGSEEEQGGGATINSPYDQIPEQLPPIPPKDPQKLQQYPPSPEQDRFYNQSDFEASTSASNQGHLGENSAPHRPSTWDRSSRPVNHPRNPSSDQLVQYQSYQSVPTSASSTSSHPLPLRGSLDLIYPQPQIAQNSRPSSRQSYQPPSPALDPTFHQRTSSLQGVPSHPEDPMAPALTQPHPGVRTVEPSQQNSQQASNRDPPSYQPYSQNGPGSTQANGASAAQYGSQLNVNNQPGGNYRGTPQPSPMVPQGGSDQGRSTPPPSRSRDDLTGHDMASLLTKYDELNEKYRKVKKYYFDKDAQVQSLQNTLAHQRLAQSRNSLDDSEYTTRFLRLDGAINNLAFNIRREWRAVPYWLGSYVNKEAPTTATKEMTAVGRACISKWVMDEILDRLFHPALEPTLSCQLKIIEKNLRRFASPTPTDEEREALTAKISNWRLSTIDGLQDMLASHDALAFRNSLTEDLVKGLTQSLMVNLKEPPPLGLDAGIVGIVELAVGIAANIPLESRDVFVEYIMPGTLFSESYMKVENALPALTNPGEKVEDDSTGSDSAEEKGEADLDSGKDVPVQVTQTQQLQQLQQQQGKKKGRFGGLMASNKKPPQGLPPPPGNPRGTDPPLSQAPKEERVRFAAFMAVEVRGRSTLVKAPVYI